MYTKPGEALEWVLTGAPPSLVGTLTFELLALTPGTTGLPADAADIREVASGVYVADRIGPTDFGLYQPRWHNGAIVIDEADQLIVNGTGQPVLPPPGAAIPTVEEIRAESDVGFAEYGYPEPTPPGVDRLTARWLDAISDLWVLTGVDAATVTEGPWVRPVRKAIRMLTEYAVTSTTQDVVETAGDFDLLSNYSISAYSETRRTGAGNTSLLVPWPALNRLLVLISDNIGNGSTGNGPDIAFADDTQPPPGWRQMMPPWMVGLGISPPGAFAPSVTDYTPWY